MSEGFWLNFDQINISHRRPFSVWIVNLLTWQNAPEGRYDEKSWEMAYNWLMMTSSGDDNWPRGSLGLLTDKTKKNKTFNKRKNRALLTFRRLQNTTKYLATTFCEKTLPGNSSESTSFPGSLILRLPSLAPGGGKMRDPGNEVGSE